MKEYYPYSQTYYVDLFLDHLRKSNVETAFKIMGGFTDYEPILPTPIASADLLLDYLLRTMPHDFFNIIWKFNNECISSHLVSGKISEDTMDRIHCVCSDWSNVLYSTGYNGELHNKKEL